MGKWGNGEKAKKIMKITLEQIVNDLVAQPGLGMFMWFCILTFAIAIGFFIWALKSGQLNDLEKSKLEMFDDKDKKEINNNG